MDRQPAKKIDGDKARRGQDTNYGSQFIPNQPFDIEVARDVSEFSDEYKQHTQQIKGD